MANTFSAYVPKIIAETNQVLRQNFGISRFVSKDFRGTSGKIGDTVTIPLPITRSTASVTPGAYPDSSTDATVTSRTITIDNWKRSAPIRITAKEGTESDLSDFSKAAIQESVRAILYDINADILSNYVDIYGYAGTAATNPFASTVNAVADLKEVLARQLCPPGNLGLCIGYEEETKALQTDDLKKMLNAGDANAMRRGDIGFLYGFNVFRDDQRPTHTAGTGSGYLINNGGGYAAGVSTVTVDTGSGTIIVGDIVTFAGHTDTYTVTSALSGNQFSFSPALTTAVADNAAVTLKATHKVNIGGDATGFGLIMRIPDMDVLGRSMGEHAAFVDPDTGIPLMISRYPVYHAEQWEVSALWGAGVADPRKLARLAG
jgi:hypothetical protein